MRTGEFCSAPRHERNGGKPLSVGWVCGWTIWGTFGAITLILFDHNWPAGGAWLALGMLIGVVGPVVGRSISTPLLQWYDRAWNGEERSQRMDGWPPTAESVEKWVQSKFAARLLLVPPLFGLFHGCLFGPYVGVLAAWDSGCAGWKGAVGGLLLGPVFISLLSGVTLAWIAPRSTAASVHGYEPWWMWLVSPVFLIPALWYCVRVLGRLPEQRRICREFTQRGAVFGGDSWNTFLGINFRGNEFTDEDLSLLGWFPDLDSLNLSGTQITDTGLTHVTHLKWLALLDLSKTRVTDAGVQSLAHLKHLWCLNLQATAVAEDAVNELRRVFPDVKIRR